MKHLKGKPAFITGGSTGIGFGMATVFARAGMNVAITDIRDEQLTIAKKELRAITDNVVTFHVDSTEIGAMESAADELESIFGPLHVLCNNAGVPGGESTILETDDAQWRRIFDVNFFGPVNGINVFLPRMLDHGEEEDIVNTASFVGIHGHGHQSAYGCSKFAVVGLSEFLRNDLADTNISVSVLCPHLADTPIVRALMARVSKDVATMTLAMAVPAETIGSQVMNAILTDEFYVYCDGTHTRSMLESRCRDLIDAMDRQFLKQ